MVAPSVPAEASAVRTAFAIAELVVFASWALLFALIFGLLITVTVLRGRARRRSQGGDPPAGAADDPLLPARLTELRVADPRFDEQLLLDVAQAACLLMFAAQSAGDEQALRRLAAPAFWSTLFGRYTAVTARDARLARDPRTGRGVQSRRHARFPVDYQATAPELVGLELGEWQRARVRVSFSQLCAVLAPGARGEAAAATATSLGSLAGALGASVSSQASSSGTGGSELSWVSWAGRFDLDFTRPGGARTDPAAALASRTCAVCGAAYRSDLAVQCGHCGAGRPLAWGEWRLDGITMVD
jgi:hypothetical protein